jgi:hypothetical protein
MARTVAHRRMSMEELMASRRSPDSPRPRASPAAGTTGRAAPVPKSVPASARAVMTREGRHALIAQKAYLRAEERGFAPGRETEDWLAAEAEVDALLRLSPGGPSQ